MYCPFCKKEIEDGSQFCSNCGSDITQKPAEEPQNTAPPQYAPSSSVSNKISNTAKWIIGAAAVVIVAMVVVFIFVILPQMRDDNEQTVLASNDSSPSVDEDEQEDAQPDEQQEEQPDELSGEKPVGGLNLKKQPVNYTLDDIGSNQYGVFIGQGAKYFPVYMPIGFNEYDFSFEKINFDMIPTMDAGDKLVFSNVSNVEFTISPVVEIDDTSLEVESLGKFKMTPSPNHIGNDIYVFDMPRNMELSYAQLYYIHAKDYGSDGLRAGFTGLAFIRDAAFDSPQQIAAPVYGDYLLPGSDKQYISESDLWGLTQWETRLARNEIYARYGYDFRTDSIQWHFENTNWYWNDPYYGYTAHKPSFNKYENNNLTLIKSYEASMGW